SVDVFRSQRASPGCSRASLGLLSSVIVQGVVGGVSVTIGNPPVLQVLHTAGAAGSWAAAVVLAVLARRAGGSAQGIVPLASSSAGPAIGSRGVPRSIGTMVSAYVQLTKPRVMSLLLATTATAMIVAARGMPDVGVFLATLVGGALMSGGAGAINPYVDRDI